MAAAATATSSAVGRRMDRTADLCSSGSSSRRGWGWGRGGRADSGFHRANTMPQRAQDGSTTFVCPQRGQSMRLRFGREVRHTYSSRPRPLPLSGGGPSRGSQQRDADGERGDARMTNRVAEATAPCRIDLAGGTLDIWPIYLFHPGAVTVNVAVDRRAYCRVETGVAGVEIVSKDTLHKARGRNVSEVLGGGELSLVAHILRALEIDSGVKVTTQSKVPAGSGLGGSSSLAVAIAAAAAQAVGRRRDADALWAIERDAEACCLRIPAGMQAPRPATHGGTPD